MKSNENNNQSIAVIGLGTIGLSLCLEIAKNNHQVIGIDTDAKKLDMLKNGHSYLFDISDNELNQNCNHLFFSNHIDAIKQCKIVIFCLPTYFKDDIPDLKILVDALKSSIKHLQKDTLIIIESTLYPGATENEILPLLAEFEIGSNLFLSHSPERIDPGNKQYRLRDITKIISGKTPLCLKKAVDFYSTFLDKIHTVSSIETAEMTKVFENTYKALNISMVNELQSICEAMKINALEVINAASTKEFGFQAHYPGPGIGGRCIPMAPVYLDFTARAHNKPALLTQAISRVNDQQIAKTISQIEELTKESGNNTKVLLLGMSYKKNINDFRESVPVKILKELKGLDLTVCDPYLDVFDEFHNAKILNTKQLNSQLMDYDLVVLLMNHDFFDIEYLKMKSKKFLSTH